MSSKRRLRCNIIQCKYDGTENDCVLYLGLCRELLSRLDTTENCPLFIHTYCIVIPYDESSPSEEKRELGWEESQPKFFIPFFYSIMDSQVMMIHPCDRQTGPNQAPLRMRVDLFDLLDRFPFIFKQLEANNSM